MLVKDFKYRCPHCGSTAGTTHASKCLVCNKYIETEEMDPPCYSCGSVIFTFQPSTQHVKMVCKECNKYVKFVPRHTEPPPELIERQKEYDTVAVLHPVKKGNKSTFYAGRGDGIKYFLFKNPDGKTLTLTKEK